MTIKELYENVAKDVLQQVEEPEIKGNVEVIAAYVENLIILMCRGDKEGASYLFTRLYHNINSRKLSTPLPEPGFGSKETMI